MKRIKIYFQNFWNGFDRDFLVWKYPCLEKYQIEQVPFEEQADVILFSSYGVDRENMTNPAKSGPNFTNKKAVRLFYFLENLNTGHPLMDRCDYAITSRIDYDVPNHFALPHGITFIHYWQDELKQKHLQPVAEKPNFCNYISCNCVEFRERFFDKLSQYKFVEALGECKNNVPRLPRDSSPRINNMKLNEIAKFKFTMAMENSCDPGYICEKHVEPMKVGSIPIYRGAPDIGKYFNTKSFFNWADYGSDEALIEAIKRADQDPEVFAAMWKEPWLVNNEIHYDISMKKCEDAFDKVFENVGVEIDG